MVRHTSFLLPSDIAYYPLLTDAESRFLSANGRKPEDWIHHCLDLEAYQFCHLYRPTCETIHQAAKQSAKRRRSEDEDEDQDDESEESEEEGSTDMEEDASDIGRDDSSDEEDSEDELILRPRNVQRERDRPSQSTKGQSSNKRARRNK